jgi:DNA-binding NarL/FixJ family response regulator
MLLIASDVEPVRERWSHALEAYRQVAQVDTFQRLRLFMEQRPLDVLLLHLSLPGMQGMHDVAELKRLQPGCRILVMADVPFDQEGLAALRMGAEGYANTHMTPKMLEKAVEVVLLGEIWVGRRLMGSVLAQWRAVAQPSPLDELTERERQVAMLVVEGMSNKQIAGELGVSERTVKAHLTSVFRKTGLKDRTALARRLSQQLAVHASRIK